MRLIILLAMLFLSGVSIVNAQSDPSKHNVYVTIDYGGFGSSCIGNHLVVGTFIVNGQVRQFENLNGPNASTTFVLDNISLPASANVDFTLACNIDGNIGFVYSGGIDLQITEKCQFVIQNDGIMTFGAIYTPPILAKPINISGESIECASYTLITDNSGVSEPSYVWQVNNSPTTSTGWRDVVTTNSGSVTLTPQNIFDTYGVGSDYGTPYYFRVRPTSLCQTSRISAISDPITFHRPIPSAGMVQGVTPNSECEDGGVTVSNLSYPDGSPYNGEGIIISITNSGGTRGYSREHSGQTSYTIRDAFLAPGTGYAIKIENAVEPGQNTCASGEVMFNIDTPPSFTINTPTINQEISCNSSSDSGSSSDGQIRVVVRNGKAPFNYYLKKGTGGFQMIVSNRNVRNYVYSNLSSGDYLVRVIDACGTLVESAMVVRLSEPSAITINASISSDYNGSDISCVGSSDGEITIMASGGAGSYEYSIDGGINYQAGNVITGLAANTYSVAVRDGNGCAVLGPSLTITAPDVVAIDSVTLTDYNGYDVSCFEGTDGQIAVSASGGTGALRYAVDGGAFQNSTIFSGLAFGTHTVEVTDSNGCTSASFSITLTDPEVLSVSGMVTSDYAGYGVSCTGSSDGELTLTAVGGVGLYEYSIDNGITWFSTSVFSNQSSGTYMVRVRDGNSCIANSTVTISDPPEITVSAVLSSYNGSEVSCNGGTDGTIELTVGGLGPFDYMWSNGATTKDLLSVGAGTYTVTIMDSRACFIEKTYILNEPFPLLASSLTSDYNGSGVSCNGASDGFIDVEVTGGTAPYSYTWSNGMVTKDLTNLVAGNYDVNVTDLNGCTISLSSITITEPVVLSLSILNATDISCNGYGDGQITGVASGGWGDYEYSLDGATWQTSATFTSLTPGAYTLYVRDGNGCEDQVTTTITEPTVLTGAIIREVDTTCGDNNGEAEISVSGGTAPYQYSWTNVSGTEVSTSAILTGVGGGIYTVTVTDGNGCSITTNANISSIDGPQVTISSIQQTTCFDSADGSASVILTGITPFTIEWSSGETGTVATQLIGGSNTVTVTDGNGCVAVEVVSIPSPLPISITQSEVIPSCYDSEDGSITVQASGGTGSYSYIWDDGTTGNTLANISQGSYTVAITDTNGCEQISTIDLIGVVPLEITVDEIVTPTCPGGADGSIQVTATGGNGTYSYMWDIGTTGDRINNVSAGDYHLTVTDQNSCIFEAILQVPEAPVFEIDLGGDIEICEGSSYRVRYPLPGATYQWTSANGFASTDEEVTLSEPGMYTLSVTNTLGCIATDSFELIVSNDLLNADFLLVSEAYAGDTVIVVDISWPTPDGITWDFGGNVQVVEQSQEYAALIYPQEGVYTINMVATLADCEDFYSQSITILPSSSKPDSQGGRLSEEEDNVITSFNVYPNPSVGPFEMKVDLRDRASVSLKVVDLTGNQIVFAYESEDTATFVLPFTGQLKPGLYLVLLKANNENSVRRIVIK